MIFTTKRNCDSWDSLSALGKELTKNSNIKCMCFNDPHNNKSYISVVYSMENI